MSLEDLEKRLAALEAHHEAVHVSVTGRLAMLEQTVKATYMRVVDMDERERKTRWHATYNAAISSCGWAGEDAHEWSATIADRAHGPLEVVVPAGSLHVSEDLLAHGCKFADLSPETKP
jgi:hypothetical protein